MFHDIPRPMAERMRRLEAIDAAQRRADLPRLERLCQVPPETGRLLALLAASAPPGDLVEVGTSGGYSTLWLALAARATGRRIHTFERLEEKAAIARETFRTAGIEAQIRLCVGDARRLLAGVERPALVFLDAEKAEYPAYYEVAMERLPAGGILVADNVLSHREVLEPFVADVLADPRLDALVVPIGKGVLVGRVP